MGFKKSPAYKYINFGISFGLTMAITMYLLYRGGQWLDARLGTYPVFMMIGILLAVGAVFKRLMADLKIMNQEDRKDDE